jgi:hypothetical protein
VKRLHLSRKELETRISELVKECDETGQRKCQLEEDLANLREDLRLIRRELDRALDKNIALSRTLKLYLENEVGE